MSLIGNILWIILGGGLFIFVEYILIGIVLCISIVGIPFGIQLFKLAMLGLAPFDREVESERPGTGLLAVMLNLMWLIIGGFWLALTHIFFALFLALTIIGIPFAKQHLKLATLAIWPFGQVAK